MSKDTKYTGTEIAIIGMAGRFPGASDLNQFWQNLANGVESIRFFTDEELLENGVDPNLLKNPAYVRANAVLDGKGQFDAAFFGFRPAEAEMMDPQLRIFLEDCWKALEDAGYGMVQNKAKTGLFAGGASNVNWMSHAILSNDHQVDEYTASQLRDVTFLSSRIAYLLNLKGSTMYLNTACSTSLVAIQKAVMSLLLRECDMAMAGGITIRNHSKRGYLYQEGMIHSKDGHCRPFDAEASGTVSGEGSGVVVLKRLKDAMQDGDHIYAIIRGAAMNNDGNDKMSFTSPSVEGQSQTILKALNMAKVPTESIGYVETHGTATPLGDPIEVEALNLAFGTNKEKQTALGSVKGNIGHVDVAAGVAGFIKTALALMHKQLPPSLHYREANPKINFKGGPFYVNTQLKEWKNGQYPRRAGISSFGIGGTNAHIVLEEAPQATAGTASRDHQLVLVSGKTPAALERNTQNLAEYLDSVQEINLADVAYSLQTGRTAFDYRKSIVCQSAKEGASLLRQLKAKKNQKALREGISPKVVFMFSGQGSQYLGMCKGLYEQEPVFKNALDECFDISQAAGKDLKALLFTKEGETINQTEFTQPLLFTVEYAMARQLMHWGLQPDSLIGHSIGEYAAACISGVFTLAVAMKLVLKRGELMQSAPKGSMLSVSLSEAALSPFLQEHSGLILATINTTDACVLSGTDEAVKAMSEALNEAGHANRILHTSHAFHSPIMESILPEYAKELDQVSFGKASIPVVNNINGEVSDAMESPDYWVDQIVKPVRFSAGLDYLLGQESTVLIEVGPGKSLSSFVASHASRQKHHQVVNTIRHPKEEINDQAFLLKSLGALWQAGVNINWKQFYEGETRRKLPLPPYSFEPTEYPVNVDAYRTIKEMTSGGDGKQSDIGQWFYQPQWKVSPLKTSKDQPERKSVLIFADDQGLSDTLSETYATAGHRVVKVKAAEHYQAESKTEFLVNPAEEKHITKLFGQLKAAGFSPDIIIHAWGIQPETEDEEALLTPCFYSLLSVLQSCQSHFGLLDKHVAVLTSGLHSVMNEPQVNSTAKSLNLGLLKVVSQEYPTVATSHLDLDLSDPSEQLSDQLYQELQDRESGKVIALCKGIRFEQIYDRIKPTSVAELGTSFKDGGIYLITGGLGKLGYQLSQHLLNQYEARLILLGRTDIEQLSKADVQANGSAVKNTRFASLQSMPGKVAYKQCDITDGNRLEEIIQEIEAEWGVINGVVHAAGIVQGHTHTLNELSLDEVQAQLLPKVQGLQVLRSQFENRPLDFCLLTSSLASVLGGIGFGAYASANSYMDYFVQAAGLEAWKSINLDGLNFDQVSDQDINGKELITVLETALAMEDHLQVVVSVSDLGRRLQKWVNREVSITPESNKPTEKIVEGNTADQLIQLWQDFFGKSGIEADDDFFELGGDSLKALTVIGQIHRQLGVEISIREFFNRPNVQDLAAYIEASAQGMPSESKAGFVAIPKARQKELYPLSSSQKRLHFLWQFDSESLAYNMPKVLRLKGDVEKDRFERVFKQLLERHDCLRTAFEEVEEDQVQRVLPEVAFELGTYSDTETECRGIIEAFIKPFDLLAPPLIRAGLMELTDRENEHLLLIDMHHIITDGVSMNLLIEEFMAMYQGLKLPDLKLSYTDYAEWQQSETQQERIATQRDFWLGQFEELPPVLELPTNRTRPAVKSHIGGSVSFVLDREQTSGIKAINEVEGATPFMFLLSIFNIFLSRLGNQTDIVVGTSIAGRPHPDLEKVMGVFVNTLPLRNQLHGQLSFIELLAQVKAATLESFEHQEYPYEDLIDELKVSRDISRNPLFDVMFSYENFELSELEIPGITLTHDTIGHEKSQFDLSLVAQESEGQLELKFEYATALFDPAQIEAFTQYFQTIVNSVLSEPTIMLSEISLVSEAEKEQLVFGFNDTKIDYGVHDKNLAELFDACARAHGDATAVTFDDDSISYQELNEKSNALAHTLLGQGVKPRDRVGILMPRSIEMMVSILAALKIGACYVPLDPDHPEERSRYIIEDCGLVLILSHPDLAGLMADGLEVTRLLVTDESQWSAEISLPKVKVLPEDLAYIIYTSGSTGKPKGAMLAHSTLVNFVYWNQTELPFKASEPMLCQSTITFDLFLVQTLLPLLTGMQVVLASSKDQKDPVALLKLIKQQQVGIMMVTPSFMRMLARQENSTDYLQSVHTIISAGELFPMDLLLLLRKVYKGSINNMYGPTETTIYSTGRDITTSDTIDIGKPMANTTVRILDRDMQLQPIGVVGEICIGGMGVADGYWNRDELTKEKFVADPYLEGERLYKSGDLGKWLPDGSIAFASRVDDQTKLRGFRVELGEIEYHLARHEQVKETVVLAKEHADDKYLVAYCVSDQAPEGRELRSYLVQHLPDYMIPSYFVHMDAFPLTANGKLNRGLLPDFEIKAESDHIAPSNDIEEELLGIWAQALNLDKALIGVNRSFFEVGGNSLNAIILISKIQKHFNVKMDLSAFFKRPSIRDLSNSITLSRLSQEKVSDKVKKVTI